MKARKIYIPTKPSKSKSIFILGLVICIYFLDNPFIADIIDGQILNYLLKPIGWIIISLAIWFFPRVRPSGKSKYQGFLNWWAFIFGFISIVVSVLAGLLDGFGKSPYSQSAKGMLINLLVLSSILIGRELVRNYFVNTFTKKENFIIFSLLAIFMTASDFSLNRYLGLHGYKNTVQFVAQYFAPEFVKNIFATYLVFWGGPLPSIIYLGLLQVFQWFSPILPNLKWITAGLIGILTPLFSLMALQNMYDEEARLDRGKQEREGSLSWMATSITSIAIIWFAVGVFPVYPSVVVTGSMEPMIMPGDVILIKKVKDIETLKKGDVVHFRRDNLLISHRIIDILKEKEGNSYRTKGDNNTVADHELVKPEQIKGKIIKVVPKLGWPTMLMKSDKEIPLEKVQF